MTDLLITAARLADGSVKDVRVRDGRIAEIARGLEGGGAEVLDAAGLHLLPGAIDLHVHARLPGGEHKEDYEHLIHAALAGGVTTIAVMPNTDPPLETVELVEANLEAARSVEPDFGCYVNLGVSTLGLKGLQALLEHPGTAAVKVYAAETTGVQRLADDRFLYRLARLLAGQGRLMMVHAQDQEILEEGCAAHAPLTHWRQHALVQTPGCEAASVRRFGRISAETRCHTHICHISSAEGLRAASKARNNGYFLSLETSPHYWTLDASRLDAEDGGRFQMNPSLRAAEDRAFIRARGLERLVDSVGSDHAPHTPEEKRLPYPRTPSGVPGVQTMLALLLDVVVRDGLSLEVAQSLVSSEPAHLMGWEDKGRIAVGCDADLVLVKLGEAHVIRDGDMKSKCGWTPYDGMEVRARVVRTMLRGRTVYKRDA